MSTWSASGVCVFFLFVPVFPLAIFGCTRNFVGKLYFRTLKSLCAIRRRRSTPRCSTLFDANTWTHTPISYKWYFLDVYMSILPNTVFTITPTGVENNHKPPSPSPPPPKCYRKKYAFLHASRFLPLSWRAPFSVISAFHQHRASRNATSLDPHTPTITCITETEQPTEQKPIFN